MCDCSLFSLGVLLHVINGKQVDQNFFDQGTIDLLRKGLYKVLSAQPSTAMMHPKKIRFASVYLELFPTA